MIVISRDSSLVFMAQSAKMCARCLNRCKDLESIPTKHRNILLCPRCFMKPDCARWLRYVEDNRDRLEYYNRAGFLVFISLEKGLREFKRRKIFERLGENENG